MTNAVTVTGNSTILLQGMNGSAQVNGQWQGQGVAITAGSVRFDAGSSISADGQGYIGVTCANNASGAGPGGGPYNCNNAGNGGSYGGLGGGPDPASIYGSDFAPFDLGSGGSGGFMAPTGGSGGGAIRLVVLNTLTNNDGSITANGGGASSGSGGGSGGSIYVTAGTLAGNGTFNANGGASQYGGGGGRIAIYYGTNRSFNSTHVVADGGVGGNAGAGTVVFLITTTIKWATPAAITYGTPLSGTQLGRNRVGARHLYVHASSRNGPVSRKADALRHLYANQRDGVRPGNRPKHYDHCQQGGADDHLERTGESTTEPRSTVRISTRLSTCPARPPLSTVR